MKAVDVDDEHEDPGALDVFEEGVAHALVHVRPFNQARQVGKADLSNKKEIAKCKIFFPRSIKNVSNKTVWDRLP